MILQIPAAAGQIWSWKDHGPQIVCTNMSDYTVYKTTRPRYEPLPWHYIRQESVDKIKKEGGGVGGSGASSRGNASNCMTSTVTNTRNYMIATWLCCALTILMQQFKKKNSQSQVSTPCEWYLHHWAYTVCKRYNSARLPWNCRKTDCGNS